MPATTTTGGQQKNNKRMWKNSKQVAQNIEQ